MKRLILLGFTIAGAGILVAATALLVPPSSESKWTVSAGGSRIANLTLLADGPRSRAEWKVNGKSAIVFIAADKKIWVRMAGGDVEFHAYKGGVEVAIVPSLLLPTLTAATDKISPAKGALASYTYGKSSATYQHDASGAKKVEVKSGAASWVIERTSINAKPRFDAALFTIKPRKGSATKMARLAGDLFGPADTSVSATAGGRGVGKGTSFSDGGDYAALSELESRDEAWKANLPVALEEFQREGKVGSARGDS